MPSTVVHTYNPTLVRLGQEEPRFPHSRSYVLRLSQKGGKDNEGAQWGKAFATRPNNLSVISETHVVEEN